MTGPERNSEPLDDFERETMAALARAGEDGTLVSRLTPERRAELERIARNTIACC